ncbi:alcohol dehydrogenase GroES domain-containing protein [Xylariales sp. PMI_506]|nr:alcohol dehydrogenase GroES domain-containing protein [Xylariales sp. PMI_506]
MTETLPKTYKGLLVTSPSEPAIVTELPTPAPTEGSVLVRPLYSWVAPYAKDVLTGGNPRGYPLPLPLVPGSFSIGRVAAAGPDAARLRPGQLVFTEPMIRARDDPETTTILQGFHAGFTAETRKLAADSWRHASYGELFRLPLENAYPVDERAIRGLGYNPEDLGYLAQAIVPFAGLHDIGLRAGETVVVAPATGNFGGAAVRVALALGARVVAVGRNAGVLEELKALSEQPGRVEVVQIGGEDTAEDIAERLARFAPIDAYLDISPPQAAGSPHVKAGFLALRRGGKVSMMGGIRGDVQIPYYPSVLKGLTVKFTFMYTRSQVKELIKLVERGIFKLGPGAGLETVGNFPLEQWEEAFELAAKVSGAGRSVYFTPNLE